MSKRELAERLQGLQSSVPVEGSGAARETEFQAVLQELETYQIELEMQNRELRESRQELEASQDRYVNLYDFAPVGYMTLTDRGLIHELNLTAAAMIGVERHWLVGRALTPWILGPDLGAFREHLKRCRDSGAGVISARMMRRDKQVIPVELSSVCTPGSSSEQTLLRTTVTDLTERKRLEDSLRDAVGRLEQERDLRERFVSALTHDLRTPLTVAKMSVQLLRRKAASAPDWIDLSGQIERSIDRVDRMIQDLLDANRIRAGESLPLKVTEFDLIQLVKETLAELAQVHGSRLVLQAGAPVRGRWSRGDLRRVIENLVGNAVKYGDTDQAITVSVVEDSRARVVISVHNFGNPIPKEEQATLFEQFRRASGAEVGGQKGWGLGLALVRGIVDAHGGEICVESDSNRGTTFRVTLLLAAK